MQGIEQICRSTDDSKKEIVQKSYPLQGLNNCNLYVFSSQSIYFYCHSILYLFYGTVILVVRQKTSDWKHVRIQMD